MVRGLYYRHFNEILPADEHVTTKWFSRPDEEFFEALAGCTGCKKNVVGNNQFVYLFNRVKATSAVSIWFFEFYSSYWAGAHTEMNKIPGYPSHMFKSEV